MNVPFLDLVAPHVELEGELISAVRSALRTAHFIGGAEVEGFEKEFAAYCRADYAVAVSTGTDALRFALIAAGVGKGDMVVTVPNTFIATTEAISQCGADIVFVDVDEHTYNMDARLLERALDQHGARVRAVIPVHLYGQMADMDAIMEAAERRNVMVIEDACQAHGAEYYSKRHKRWFRAGSMGKAAAFSFYPGKNLGACGEGGAVTTNDAAIAQKVKMLRDHGQARKYYHDLEGYNGRLDAIQCAMLRIKLRRLDFWNERRREAAARYRTLLDINGAVIVPHEPAWSKAVYHLYVVRAKNRDALQRHLGNAGVSTGLHYPVPLHLQKAYANCGFRRGDFPVTEQVAEELLSLPMFPQLTEEQQLHVARTISQSVAMRASAP